MQTEDPIWGYSDTSTTTGSQTSSQTATVIDPVRLKDLCDEGVANTNWSQQPDGTTYCNFFVNYVAKGMGTKASRD